MDDAERALLVAERGEDPHQLLQEQVAGRKQEDDEEQRRAERPANAGERVGGPRDDAGLGEHHLLRRAGLIGPLSHLLNLLARLGQARQGAAASTEAIPKLLDDLRGLGEHLCRRFGEEEREPHHAGADADHHQNRSGHGRDAATAERADERREGERDQEGKDQRQEETASKVKHPGKQDNEGADDRDVDDAWHGNRRRLTGFGFDDDWLGRHKTTSL